MGTSRQHADSQRHCFQLRVMGGAWRLRPAMCNCKSPRSWLLAYKAHVLPTELRRPFPRLLGRWYGVETCVVEAVCCKQWRWMSDLTGEVGAHTFRGAVGKGFRQDGHNHVGRPITHVVKLPHVMSCHAMPWTTTQCWNFAHTLRGAGM